MPNWRTMVGHKTFDDLYTVATQRLGELGSGVITNLNMGPFRLLLSLALEAVSVVYDYIADVLAPSGFTAYATGEWLDESARRNNVIRRDAVTAEGLITFGRSAPGGPVVIQAGTIVKTDPLASGDALLYLTTVDAILPDGALTVQVPATAEFPGAEYNLSDGAIKALLTHVPGIDFVRNDPGWLTVAGADDESDSALRTRATLAWQGLATGGTAGAYRSWALDVAGVVEAAVVTGEPRGPGTLDVIITGTTGSPTAQLLSDVQAYIDQKKPLLDNVLVKGPTVKALDLTVQLTLPPVGGDEATAQAEAERRIRALFTLDDDLAPAVKPLVPGQGLNRSQLVWLCWISPVENAVVTLPAADEPAVPGQLLALGILTVTVVRRA